jgi:hypothetical protein
MTLYTPVRRGLTRRGGGVPLTSRSTGSRGSFRPTPVERRRAPMVRRAVVGDGAAMRSGLAIIRLPSPNTGS